MTTPEANRPLTGDGWIEWTGGENPIVHSGPFWVRLRDGEEFQGHNYLRWHHAGNGGDIIAYRLARPAHPEPERDGAVERLVKWLSVDAEWQIHSLVQADLRTIIALLSSNTGEE